MHQWLQTTMRLGDSWSLLSLEVQQKFRVDSPDETIRRRDCGSRQRTGHGIGLYGRMRCSPPFGTAAMAVRRPAAGTYASCDDVASRIAAVVERSIGVVVHSTTDVCMILNATRVGVTEHMKKQRISIAFCPDRRAPHPFAVNIFNRAHVPEGSSNTVVRTRLHIVFRDGARDSARRTLALETHRTPADQSPMSTDGFAACAWTMTMRISVDGVVAAGRTAAAERKNPRLSPGVPRCLAMRYRSIRT